MTKALFSACMSQSQLGRCVATVISTLFCCSHLFVGFEDVALEDVGGAISGYVTEDLQVLRVM